MCSSIKKLSGGRQVVKTSLFSRLNWNSCDKLGIIASYENYAIATGGGLEIFAIGLNLFKWPQPANPNSTTPFEIQFSFKGLIESADVPLKSVKTSLK